MELGSQLLFFVSALGVFNGLLMSFYFLRLSFNNNRPQHLFFGMLLLALCFRIGKSVLYHFDRGLPKVVLQIGLSAGFFIGPLLFLYLRSSLKKEQFVLRKEKLHLAILLVIMLAVGMLFPYASKPAYWNPRIVQGIYAVWLVYVMLSIQWIWPTVDATLKGKSELGILGKWRLIVWGINLVVCLVFHSILYFGFPPYIFGSIIFSLLFYGLLAFLLLHPDSRTIIQGEKPKYRAKKFDAVEADSLHERLQEIMQEQRLYEEPDLKLNRLAEVLQIQPYLLSQFLNDNLEKGFSEFVNGYRVQAACKLLKTEHQFTIEAISREVGFRSKSSFYQAFKKQTGLTPNQFLKKVKSS